MHQSTSLVPVKPDPYIENWRNVLGTAAYHLKFVRISNGVGTVTNGTVLLRAPITIEDGFYKLVGAEACRMLPVIDIQNSILEAAEEIRWNGSKYYPDIDQFNPRLETLPILSYLLRDDVLSMMNLCQDVLQDSTQSDRALLLMSANGITSSTYPNDRNYTIQFNFSIPDGEVLILQGQALKIALTECSKYDSVPIRVKKTKYAASLILGDSWRSCALVTCSVRRMY